MKTIHYITMLLVLSFFSYQGMSQGLYKHTHVHTDMLFKIKSEGERKPLHKAAVKGNVEKVRQLLAKGIDVNTRNKKKQTALHLASMNGFTEIVDLLLKADAEVDAKDKTTRTPLHYAGVANHLEVVKLLIKAGANLETIEPKHKGTVLHLAAEEGHVEMTELLMMSGADMNASCTVGWSPLHAAAGHGQLAVVRLLLEHGASPNGKDTWGKRPIDYSKGEIKDVLKDAMTANQQVADVLSPSNEDLAPMLRYAAGGDLEGVKKLLSSGTDVNASYDVSVSTSSRSPYSNGVTALIVAARSGHAALCRFLLDQGADIHARTEKGAFYLSRKSLNYDEKRKLKAREGVSFDALEAAASSGHLEVVKLLVEAGAKVNPKDESASVPLYMAVPPNNDDAFDHYIEVIKYLIAQGADVNRVSPIVKWTVLHMAAYSNHKAIAELLVKEGSDLEARDINEFTPVIMAAFHHSYDVLKVYKDAGADLTAKNEFGKSAIDMAKADPNCPIVFD